MKYVKLFTALLLGVFWQPLAAQPAEMADVMRSEGKIYVVVSIILVIFIGLITYLILIDRKISRLEKKVMDKKTGA